MRPFAVGGAANGVAHVVDRFLQGGVSAEHRMKEAKPGIFQAKKHANFGGERLGLAEMSLFLDWLDLKSI